MMLTDYSLVCAQKSRLSGGTIWYTRVLPGPAEDKPIASMLLISLAPPTPVAYLMLFCLFFFIESCPGILKFNSWLCTQ